MATNDQKLCWKCEEEVHPQAVVCPYCRADLIRPLSKSETEASYRFVAASSDSEVPSPLYSPPQKEEISSGDKKGISTPTPFKGSVDQALLSTILLLSGAVFLLFGLVLLFFSREGILALHWKGNYWPVYFIFSLPLLFFGWKALKQVDNHDE